jgi:hypothetical protein
MSPSSAAMRAEHPDEEIAQRADLESTVARPHLDLRRLGPGRAPPSRGELESKLGSGKEGSAVDD